MTVHKKKRGAKKAKKVSVVDKQKDSKIKLVEAVEAETAVDAATPAVPGEEVIATVSDATPAAPGEDVTAIACDATPAVPGEDVAATTGDAMPAAPVEDVTATAGDAIPAAPVEDLAATAGDATPAVLGEDATGTFGEAPLDSPHETDRRSKLPAWLRGFDDFEQFINANFKSIASWIWDLRAPLLLLFAIALQPKFILLWIVIVLAKPIGTWLYARCSQGSKERLASSLPAPIRNSPLLRDLGEGADQGLPFILFWLYLFCAPFAIAWIGAHWLKSFWRSPVDSKKVDNGFVFAQNRKPDAVHSENNFYYSRAFSIVLFAFFAFGIPSFISYAIYENLGVEKIMSSTPAVGIAMGNPSAAPQPTRLKMGLAGSLPLNIEPKKIVSKAPTGGDSTVVMGYNGYWPFLRNFGLEPTKSSTLFVHFYLVSLASVLSILFFRAWFLFPLNFITDDHDVEVTESGVRRKSMMRGWFLSVITMNRWAIGGGADSLKWDEVKSLRRIEEGFFKLSPLPETAFKRESLAYKLLNKIAALIDGISNRPAAGNYLVFSSAVDKSDFGRNIKINLNDLSREQRAKLYYAVKTWAPHVVINPRAEEQLLGSNVLTSNRYTQLWFDILTSRAPRKKNNVLAAGELLKGGEYLIENRISSGGQATTYLATSASGKKFALKEFILTTSTTSGALIESASEFEAEVSLLSQLNHPGIVKLEDFFSEGGRLYVAMEYIEGQSLRQKVASEGPLPQQEVVRIAQATCDVLGYLHNCNPPIVHRDITPENILVDSNGNIKVIDFSLAVKQDGRQTTDSCAKQAFTPPEQFREEVCVQSDIYALGATMHFLLTGRTPKPISTSSPKLLADNVPSELNAIVERATQLDLERRYESAEWLRTDLTAFQDGARNPLISQGNYGATSIPGGE